MEGDSQPVQSILATDGGASFATFVYDPFVAGFLYQGQVGFDAGNLTNQSYIVHHTDIAAAYRIDGEIMLISHCTTHYLLESN